MPGLISSLYVQAGAINAFEQAIAVTSANVSNASTPGYASQTQTLVAVPEDIGQGATGGVEAGPVVSSRDHYADQAVWNQQTALGGSTQSVDSLTSLQSLFNVTGTSGISTALSSLYQSFSAWGQTPSDSTAQQAVLTAAGNLATAFQQTASGLASAATTAQAQLQQTVNQVNTLVGQLQQLNTLAMGSNGNDSGLDAQINSAIENLSQYIPVSATEQPDGTYTVMLDGQTPLVIGSQQFPLSFDMYQPADATNTDAPPLAQVIDANGTDITSDITGGQLGALLNFRNTVLPSYIGDGTQAGSLNTMAQQFADTVNGILTSGNISDASADGTTPAVPGVPLFTYDTTNATNVAASLAVSSTITPGQLAAIDPGPPEVSNGIPLALTQLENPESSADEINGESYTAAFGDMATQAGNLLNDATEDQQVAQSALTQAQNLQQQQSGVDLDQQAVTLVQYQSSYEANAEMITVLNQLMQDTINILEPGTT
ncbi:MAG: flagellar hook-associated protein FlgK [Bryobacteraceae bacterium]|jgi:flagellar hook-associated protein 1 FlgK